MLVELNQKTALGVPGTAIRLSRANITSSILLKVGLRLLLSLCLSIISSILSPVYHKYNARTVPVRHRTTELLASRHHAVARTDSPHGWNID
ncbi:hypothetical protein BDL97_15G061900 [Sphagnum fallax]|nr:hypothetical protein BDL97_15G061900 [Sphagnum fallax]